MALKTNWKDDIFSGNRKYQLTNNTDGTVSLEDKTAYTQTGDVFGANELNGICSEINTELEATKKSVSDGKTLIAAAITQKKVTTAADATFAQMATNIKSIISGAGTAIAADVLTGKTFTNSTGIETAGTMPDKSGTTQAATPTVDTANSRLQMTVPALGKYTTASKIYATYSTMANLIGLAAAKLWPGNTVLGITSSNANMAGSTITPSTSTQTVSCSGKAMTGNIVVNAIPSNYYNVNNNQTVFNSGSYGLLGALGAFYSTSTTSSGRWTSQGAAWIVGNDMVLSIWETNSFRSACVFFRRAISWNPHKYIQVVASTAYTDSMAQTSTNYFYVRAYDAASKTLLKSSDTSFTSSSGKVTVTLNLSANAPASGEYFICLQASQDARIHSVHVLNSI